MGLVVVVCTAVLLQFLFLFVVVYICVLIVVVFEMLWFDVCWLSVTELPAYIFVYLVIRIDCGKHNGTEENTCGGQMINISSLKGVEDFNLVLSFVF